MHLSLIKLHYIGFLNYMTIRFVVHLEQYFFLIRRKSNLLYSKTRPFYNKNGYFLENSNLGHVLRVNTVNNQFGYTDFEITDVIY